MRRSAMVTAGYPVISGSVSGEVRYWHAKVGHAVVLVNNREQAEGAMCADVLFPKPDRNYWLSGRLSPCEIRFADGLEVSRPLPCGVN